jgi:hypothetical protein
MNELWRARYFIVIVYSIGNQQPAAEDEVFFESSSGCIRN